MGFTTLIDVSELCALSAGAARHGQTVLLDCRFDLKEPGAGRQGYLAGHIPGARYADLNRDLASTVRPDSGRHPLPAPQALARFFAAAGIGDGTQVVAYDEANGLFAARAWWLLNGKRCLPSTKLLRLLKRTRLQVQRRFSARSFRIFQEAPVLTRAPVLTEYGSLLNLSLCATAAFTTLRSSYLLPAFLL